MLLRTSARRQARSSSKSTVLAIKCERTMAGAPKGNTNAAKSRLFDASLRRYLTQNPDDLRIIVEKLAEMAKGGDRLAIAEIADRLDGKPAQTLDVTNHDPKRSPDELSESDLDARIAAVESRLTGEEVKVQSPQQLN